LGHHEIHDILLSVDSWWGSSYSAPNNSVSTSFLSSNLLPMAAGTAKLFQVILCQVQRWWKARVHYAECHPDFRCESMFQSFCGKKFGNSTHDAAMGVIPEELAEEAAC
jgi:hypothetical protein